MVAAAIVAPEPRDRRSAKNAGDKSTTELFRKPSLAHSRAMLPYVPLRTFSSFTMLEGAVEPKAIAKQAAKLGFPAIAVTDRNGLYGVMPFSDACTAEGVQPIVGATVAVARPEDGALTLDCSSSSRRTRQATPTCASSFPPRTSTARPTSRPTSRSRCSTG